MICIVCALGITGITSMRQVETKAELMAEAYVPEVVVGNALERHSLLAMYNMRGFVFSGDMVYRERALEHLNIVDENLRKAEALGDSHPALVKLREGIARLEEGVAKYESLAEHTAEISARVAELHKKMDIMGARFISAVTDLRRMQDDRLGIDIEIGKEADALLFRHKISVMVGAIKEKADEARLLADRAYWDRVPEQFTLVDDKFSALDSLFDTLAQTVRSAGDRGMIKATRTSVAEYRAAVAELEQALLSLQQLTAEREHTADTVLKVTSGIAEAGLAQTGKIADDANDSLGFAERVLLVGLCLAVVLAVLIAWGLTRSIITPLGKVVGFASSVAEGDLNSTLDEERADELGQLADAIRSMVSSLKERIEEAAHKSREADKAAAEARNAMQEAEESSRIAQAGRESILQAAEQLQTVAEAVTSASEQLSAQIQQSSNGADVQKQRADEAATAMEQMTASVIEVARNAGSAAESAGNTRDKAHSGAQVVRQAVTQIGQVQEQSERVKEDMGRLGTQAENIGQIMNVISDIADQTNLLALNAAIEAARAGEAGRGFAVVADEVRKLAEKTMAATKEVGAAISGIQEGTRTSVANVDLAVQTIAQAASSATESGAVLEEIVSLVVDVTEQVQNIATAAEEQSAASEQISRSVEEVNVISTETSQGMEQAGQAVSDLADQALRLKTLIDDMITQGSGS